MAKKHTQKAMGRGKLVERLTAQVGSRAKAIAILKKRGHMTKDGKLTPSGFDYVNKEEK